MSSFTDTCIFATERVLLLLGWERVVNKSKHNFVYKDDSHERVNGAEGSARRRRKDTTKNGGETRPSKAAWEKNAPTLGPVKVVTTSSLRQATNVGNQMWESSAFDTAVTGTV